MAKVNPFTALVEGGRDLISGQSFDALLAYGIALALAALFSVWAVRGLRKAEAAGGWCGVRSPARRQRRLGQGRTRFERTSPQAAHRYPTRR